jgi:hypothetical protein
VETNGIGGFAPTVLKAALKQAKIHDCGVSRDQQSTANKNKRILEALEDPLASGTLWAHTSVLEGPAYEQMRDWNPAIKDQPDDTSTPGRRDQRDPRADRPAVGLESAGTQGRDDWRPSGGCTRWNSLGNPTTAAPVSGSAAALAIDLVSTASAAKNAGQVGFNGALNYVGQTLGKRILAIGADPRSLGAPADGVSDDTPYWTQALLYSKTLDVRNGTWKLNSTVSCIAGLSIDARGATINLNTGATPGLQQLNGNAGLTIHGGYWQGTASSWLFLQGKTTTPALQTDYASVINLYGVQVSSATITNAMQ